MEKIALITAIENINNKNNKNGDFKFKRNYEEEAIKCFKNWRKKAEWLKDIPIYTMCATENFISNETIEELKKLNVKYIEKKLPETDLYNNGFLHVYSVGKYLEENLDEDIFIHIDLDMNLFKELPKDLFNIKNYDVICGAYDKSSLKYQRNNFGKEIFDTGFIISQRKSLFYTKFMNGLLNFLNNIDEKYKLILKERKNLPLNNYDIEEYYFDKIYHENTFNLKIKPVKNYQLGEGYPSIDEYNDNELENIYFWHEHLYYDKNSYNKLYEKLTFKKRLKRYLNGKKVKR